MTIQELSEQRIGQIWTQEDHERLCRIMMEIEKTAAGAMEYARKCGAEDEELRSMFR